MKSGILAAMAVLAVALLTGCERDYMFLQPQYDVVIPYSAYPGYR